MLAMKLLQVSLKVMLHRIMFQIFCIYSTETFLSLTSNTFSSLVCEPPKFLTHKLALKIGRKGNLNPYHLGEIF